MNTVRILDNNSCFILERKEYVSCDIRFFLVHKWRL